MFTSLKNKIKEETGSEVPKLTGRQNSIGSRYSRGSIHSILSIDELSQHEQVNFVFHFISFKLTHNYNSNLILQKDAEINALTIQLNDVTLKCKELEQQIEILADVKKQYEKDTSLLEESLKVAQG